MYLVSNILDMNTPHLDPRQQRGLVLAMGPRRLKQIIESTWVVPSQSHTGSYVVDVAAGTCTCPDHELRGPEITCKHRWAVEFARHRVAVPHGSTMNDDINDENNNDKKEDDKKVDIPRPTYGQDWPRYNAAQRSEKGHVKVLLRALCDTVHTPPQVGRGRRRARLDDVIFGAAMKTFVGLSGRRAETDLKVCVKDGFLTKLPSYNTIFEYVEDPALTPVLKGLIRLSALPLAAIEQDFAIDGTGFGSSISRRWLDKKHGSKDQREDNSRAWVKLHAICGVKTHVITAVEVTDSDRHDSPLLPQLVQETAEGFTMETVSADKGYLGVRNLEAIEGVGAVPYVAFKKNSKGDGPDVWRRAYHMFSFHRDQWLTRYHKRSNVETVFSSIKRKFGPYVRSRKEAAMFNEVLLKCLCHNLSCLVHASHELGIDPTFRSLGDIS